MRSDRTRDVPRRPHVAFVVARCGPEAIGGAERLCLETATQMAQFWDVEILTTCATDYATWQNVYPPGIATHGNVPIRRFPVDRVRDRALFDRLSVKLACDPASASAADQRAWMAAQGPDCSALGDYVRAGAASFDAVYFYSYLYATTYDNIATVADKAVLVSLSHDEWMLRLPIWDRVFSSAHRIVCLSPEEEHLLTRRFGAPALPTRLISIGIDEPAAVAADADVCRTLNMKTPFTLYVGRVDAAKNCDELVSDFIDLVSRDPAVPNLVLIGPVSMKLPEHPALHVHGPAGEELKQQALAAASFVIIPSLFESLSLVALESWTQSTAILANGASSVLVGQCRRSGGGVWYANRGEFQEQYATCLQGQAQTLGRQGYAYVSQFFKWEDVTLRHRKLLQR